MKKSTIISELREGKIDEFNRQKKEGEIDSIPVPEIREIAQVKLIGEHPLKTDGAGRPLNTSPCLFSGMLITGRPNHSHAIMKKTLMDTYKSGEGVDVNLPGLDIHMGDKLEDERLDVLAQIMMTHSDSLNPGADGALTLDRECRSLNKTAS